MSKTIPLSELCKISGRVGWKGYTVYDLRDEGPWVIGANDITSDHTLDLSEAKHISREKFEESPEIMIELNDILIVKVGSTIGKIAIVNRYIGEACINPNTVLLKNCTINPYYLYYYLISSAGQSFIKNHSSASAQPALNQTDLKNMPVVVYDINNQNKIADCLNDINAKIELNNKINYELESMAKTLYDYWFVQFDFPNEQGKPYKSSGGLMVYNEEFKREIPEGWEVKLLMDLSEKIGDGIHGTPQYINKSAYSFINGNNLKNGFIQIDEETKKVSQTEYEKYFIELNKESILLSINGTLGNLAVFTNEKVILGKSSAYINCKEKHRSFCYQFLIQNHIQKTFWLIATGSTIKNLSLASLKNLKLVYPGIEIVKQFDNIIKPIDIRRENIFKQNQQLTTLRDWLLPMLMNGQVTV